eukprot:6196048-Pleurochrysis_carterae.AAC.4
MAALLCQPAQARPSVVRGLQHLLRSHTPFYFPLPHLVHRLTPALSPNLPALSYSPPSVAFHACSYSHKRALLAFARARILSICFCLSFPLAPLLAGWYFRSLPSFPSL